MFVTLGQAKNDYVDGNRFYGLFQLPKTSFSFTIDKCWEIK